MAQTALVEFGRIDATADPAYFIRFLDAACAAESFQAYKRRLVELLHLRPGGRYLDVGCGTGDDVRDMAKGFDPSGRIVGIDNSQAMIDVARQRATGLELPVEFVVGDVHDLPFAAGSFAGCRADRSLMHVPDIKKALAEMARVTEPGGAIVVFEVDFGTLVIDADDRVLARKIVNTWCDSFRNGWLGRHMAALFQETGLADVMVVPYVLVLTPELALPLFGKNTVERAVDKGIITKREGDAWLEHLDELQRTRRFFSCMTGFLVSGRNPS
jgi:ubiquinone/menaquinone biosynthesis C-methylase UbiE